MSGRIPTRSLAERRRTWSNTVCFAPEGSLPAALSLLPRVPARSPSSPSRVVCEVRAGAAAAVAAAAACRSIGVTPCTTIRLRWPVNPRYISMADGDATAFMTAQRNTRRGDAPPLRGIAR